MAKRDGRSSRNPKKSVACVVIESTHQQPQESPPATTTQLAGHPELSVITTYLGHDASGPKHVEYRVDNFRTLRSGRIIRSAAWSVIDIVALALVFWTMRQGETWTRWESCDFTCQRVFSHGWALLLGAWTYTKSQRVLWESVTPLPGLGMQLSSTRGLQIPFCSTRLPILTSHTFIPLSEISTIIINEGLTRWGVKHYLAVVKKGGQGVVVALGNVRPSLPVLKEVYHGVRETMWDEFGSAEND